MIEAHYLFGAEYDDIEIVVHPQSIIHSMVETQVTVHVKLGAHSRLEISSFYYKNSPPFLSFP